MELREQIGSWRYRVCYATDDAGVCVKKLRNDIQKKYFWIEIWYLSRLYKRRKSGVWNFNVSEYHIFLGLPDELKPYVPSLVKLHNDDLVQERIRDHSWSYSPTLEHIWEVADESFWIHIEKIRDIFAQRWLWFLDVFHKGNNILVKKDMYGYSSPVLIDLKRLWRDTYPFQLNLLFRGQLERKFTRRFEKFKKHFKQTTNNDS